MSVDTNPNRTLALGVSAWLIGVSLGVCCLFLNLVILYYICVLLVLVGCMFMERWRTSRKYKAR
jgi:hypothetical protein